MTMHMQMYMSMHSAIRMSTCNCMHMFIRISAQLRRPQRTRKARRACTWPAARVRACRHVCERVHGHLCRRVHRHVHRRVWQNCVTDLCADMCVGMCTHLCIDMCMHMGRTHVYRHAHRHGALGMCTRHFNEAVLTPSPSSANTSYSRHSLVPTLLGANTV